MDFPVNYEWVIELNVYLRMWVGGFSFHTAIINVAGIFIITYILYGRKIIKDQVSDNFYSFFMHIYFIKYSLYCYSSTDRTIEICALPNVSTLLSLGVDSC